MPKVPEEQQAQFNTSNIPGVMFPFGQQFGKIGEATEKVGNAIEQGASTYNEVQNRLNTLQATEDATTIYNNIALNDTIRIEVRSKGFLDPYTTMVNIEILCDSTMCQSTEILKLDQSAHSLFSELRISCKGIMLEDI